MYYFAYGSSLMAARWPNASTVGVARLQGYGFRINSRRYGTVVRDRTHRVYGLLRGIAREDLLVSAAWRKPTGEGAMKVLGAAPVVI